MKCMTWYAIAMIIRCFVYILRTHTHMHTNSFTYTQKTPAANRKIINMMKLHLLFNINRKDLDSEEKESVKAGNRIIILKAQPNEVSMNSFNQNMDEMPSNYAMHEYYFTSYEFNYSYFEVYMLEV